LRQIGSDGVDATASIEAATIPGATSLVNPPTEPPGIWPVGSNETVASPVAFSTANAVSTCDQAPSLLAARGSSTDHASGIGSASAVPRNKRRGAASSQTGPQPRIRIGNLEIRVMPPAVPTAPPPQRPAVPAVEVRLARGLGWHYGLIQS
jgi:hypothetical protein